MPKIIREISRAFQSVSQCIDCSAVPSWCIPPPRRRSTWACARHSHLLTPEWFQSRKKRRKKREREGKEIFEKNSIRDPDSGREREREVERPACSAAIFRRRSAILLALARSAPQNRALYEGGRGRLPRLFVSLCRISLTKSQSPS